LTAVFALAGALMPVDEWLISQALNLSDGADIHTLMGIIGIYRCLAAEQSDDCTDVCGAIEREIRQFLIKKRLSRIPSSMTGHTVGAD